MLASRHEELQQVAELSAELEAMADGGDWQAAALRVAECQRLLAKVFADHRTEKFDADDRDLIQRILGDNRALLRRAEGRRRELGQAGIELRRNRRAVNAYAQASG